MPQQKTQIHRHDKFITPLVLRWGLKIRIITFIGLEKLNNQEINTE